MPGPYVLAGHSLGGMFVLSYAHRYPSEVGGVVLLDSMHPRQSNTAASDMGPVLDVVPTVARTGIARLLFDPKDGEPAAQARQFVRDVEQMPAQLNRAAQLKTLGSRPLGVVTAGTGSQPGWTQHQNDLATLSSNSVPPHGRRIDAPVADRRSEGRRGLQPRHPRRRRRGTQQGRGVAGDASLSPSPRTRCRRNAGPRSPRSPGTTARCVADRPSVRACSADTRSGGIVSAASEREALQLLPHYIAERTTVVAIADVEIP